MRLNRRRNSEEPPHGKTPRQSQLGQAGAHRPGRPTITSFELVVKEYKLTPDQYVRSTRLREWARRNKNSKYIPEALLEAWGFEIESTL